MRTHEGRLKQESNSELLGKMPVNQIQISSNSREKEINKITALIEAVA